MNGFWSTAILVVLAAACRERAVEPANDDKSKNDSRREAALKAARVWFAPKVPI